MDNQFIYRRKFPDPRTIFNRSQVEIDDLFENAIFILDANVLLAPFQIGKDNLEKIHKVYSHLNKENRIFIPEHALLEFYNNRSIKISDLFTVIDKYLSELPSIKEFNYPILEQLTAYSEILMYRSEISEKVKKYKDSLNKLKDGVTNWNWSDPVTMMYKEVFSEKNIISIEEDEKSLIEEYTKRITNEIPPGNRDSAKSNNSIGDFIIWKTIIKIGKDLKTNVVFVSNDEKNDWMLKGNKKSISTRYELIDEFFRETGGFNFLSITYDNFLKRQGLIVEEIENKRNIRTINIESILQKLNHSFLMLLNEINSNEEHPHIDSDILDPEIYEFNDTLNRIKDTISFSDEILLFDMK
ncbi:PIN domain-containing protein, partial [Algoriphagus sp. A40]|uniref:PIN domain-containing protein n=1 Tax=Algoriphagus sp. A40 TaxID=1945863 RepID=UPI000986BEB1